MAKGKRIKETNTKAPLIAIILVVIFLIVGIFVISKIILENKNINIVAEEENKQILEKTDKEYEIASLENYTFENAKIKVENNVSYVNIDVKNNGIKKTTERKVTLIFANANKQMRTTYTIPEIESNGYYTISFNIISNLSDIEKIEIE